MSNRIFYSKYAEDKNNLSQLRNRVKLNDPNCSLENNEKNDNVNTQLEPVKKTFCMNTYKRAYYLKNKEIIIANAKRCEKLKRNAIKKFPQMKQAKKIKNIQFIEVDDLTQFRSILKNLHQNTFL